MCWYFTRVHWWSFLRTRVSNIICVWAGLHVSCWICLGGETQKATNEVRRAEGSGGMLGKGRKVERIAEKEMMYGCREWRMESRGQRRRGFEEKHWEGQRNVINGVFVMVKTDIENRRIKERDGFMNRLDCWECWARKKENILKTIGWIRCDIFWFVYVGENQRKNEGKKENFKSFCAV